MSKTFITILIFSLILLLSNWTVPVLNTPKIEAQPTNSASLEDKIDDPKKNAQDTGKKLRDTNGVKIPNQYIVVLKDGVSSRSSAEKAISQGAGLKHIYLHALRGYAITAPNESVLEAVMKNPEIEYVQPDTRMEAFAQSLPKGINRVDGDLSSTKSGDGGGTVNVDIGIMDTGIQLSHPDLNVYTHVTFVPGTSSGNDDNGHGTSVAGIAAAKDNSEGVVGIAPGARLWAIKVLDNNGIGMSSDIIKGIDYVTAHANEIDVVNLSFGSQGSNDALRAAIIRSVAAGVTYVAAAGNDAMDASSFVPASYPEVIAVSAIVDTDGKCGGLSSVSTTAGSDDTFASFSNHGSVIDMAAPGVQIQTTTRGSSYSLLSGTSASTPHVTGAAALYEVEHPGATPSNIRNALRSAGSLPATICDGNGHGYFTGDRDSIAEPLLYMASTSPLPQPSQCGTNLPIGGVTARGFQSGYPPSNAIDNNFGTRWSHSLFGSWIRVDLGSTKSICSVNIAWFNGDQRQYHFVIATSTDGITFTNRFSGDSSGTTSNSEKYTFASTNARYVRVTVNGNTQNNYASMYEIDVFGSAPNTCTGTNLPIGGVTARGFQSGYPPSNAIDNNFGTRWSHSLFGSWIRVDLGSTKSICSVDIAWFNGNQRQYHFVIATSTDGTTFTNKVNRDSSGTTLNPEKYTFSSTNARYVRVTVNGNTQNNYASMYEIDVRGSSSTSSTGYDYGPGLSLSGPP